MCIEFVLVYYIYQSRHFHSTRKTSWKATWSENITVIIEWNHISLVPTSQNSSEVGRLSTPSIMLIAYHSITSLLWWRRREFTNNKWNTNTIFEQHMKPVCLQSHATMQHLKHKCEPTDAQELYGHNIQKYLEASLSFLFWELPHWLPFSCLPFWVSEKKKRLTIWKHEVP